MNHISKDEIRELIETLELERAEKDIAFLEEREGFYGDSLGKVKRLRFIKSFTGKYLKLLGLLSLGFGSGVFTVILSYFIFVWLLHLSF